MLSEQNPEIRNSDNRNKPKTNQKTCSFFNSKSGCKFGDKCKFRHEVLNRPSVECEEAVKSSANNEPVNEDEDEVLNHLQEQSTAESNVETTHKDLTVEAAHETRTEASENSQPKICNHYSRLGWCRFGKRCRFSHPKSERGRGRITKNKGNSDRQFAEDEQIPVNEGSEILKEAVTKTVDNDGEKKPQQSIKKQVCRFYVNSNCKFESTCKYSHDGEISLPPPGNAEQNKGKVNEAKPRAIVNPQRQRSVRGQQYNKDVVPQGNPSKPTKGRSYLTKDELLSLKKTECDQLKKRFPLEKLQIISESEECCYSFEFFPTDPDWPFDIRSFTLKVTIPAQYPFQLFTVELPDDGLIPVTVRNHIEVKVTEWLEEKQCGLEESQRVELVFRPFLRWFDRSLENIVTEGLRRYQRELAAKAAGFEFIPSKGPAEQIEDDPSLVVSTTQSDEEHNDDSEEDDSSYEENSSDEDSDNDRDHKDPKAQDFSNVERKGTEIMLRHLQLKDSAATLVFPKLTIIIQCLRCKNTSELNTPGGRLNSIQCVKCNSDQRVIYRPAMSHHFSSVIGYLDLADCRPFDLVLQDSTGTLSCLNCSKDIKLQGFVPGQLKQTWCPRCHHKLTLAAESVRFQKLQPSQPNEEGHIHQVQVSKVRRLPKDPAIQEGMPLPAEGTCKHYKKSFRWLRFPCCGKCYPCDICHEDKEGDHEMKYAGRMICGFCCKEQPFDIRSFTLKVTIPAQYPFQLFTVELPDDGLIPVTVRNHIEVKVTEWLEEKQCGLEESQRVELVFRPFLRWFDRSLENIVTEGLRRYQRELAAKAAGFEFIPSKGPAEQIEDDPSLVVSTTQSDEEHNDDSEEDDSSYEENSSDEDSDNDRDHKDPKAQDFSNVERKGTEIMLRHLQLKDSAATLVFPKLTIIIQCLRCKNTSELNTPGGRLNSIQCVKCNSDQRVIYRPAMSHHFSSVIGYLDLADCRPFDLVLQDSTGTLSCLNCSKDIKLQGFVPGQLKQTWCPRCHHKLTLAAESVRFQQLQPSQPNEEGHIHQVQVSKVRRLPKDPAIQEGMPLPAEGTCKHYKKSFRWLRFPCCGKCYPCDICHEDKEGDHEMKYAGRMICGFCCKEQPYTVEKPCVLCGSQLTKARSTHWEGGKGCRDKIKMSRNDDQKYANMGKTISKRAQEKLESKRGGKKTTKLRHT